MMEEQELQEFFARQPKPALRPFLATRVKAARTRKQRRLRASLHLIWTAVLVACLLACTRVHLPGAAIAVILAAGFPLALRLAEMRR